MDDSDGESSDDDVDVYARVVGVALVLIVFFLVISNPPAALALGDILLRLVVVYLLYRLVTEVARVADALE
jgi:hypothetical protein